MNIDNPKFQEDIQARDKYKQEESIKYDELKKGNHTFWKIQR